GLGTGRHGGRRRSPRPPGGTPPAGGAGPLGGTLPLAGCPRVAGGRPGVPEAVRRRLATLDRWWNPYSWLVTAVIVAIAAILRLVGLSSPKGYIFDGVYYPTAAWDMLEHGGE